MHHQPAVINVTCYRGDKRFETPRKLKPILTISKWDRNRKKKNSILKNSRWNKNFKKSNPILNTSQWDESLEYVKYNFEYFPIG